MKNIPHISPTAEPLVKTACLPVSDHSLAVATKLLVDGSPVAVPTETVYGLAADALNPAAVVSIYAAKGRPADNPLIVHVGDRIRTFQDLIAVGLVAPLTADSRQRMVAERLIQAFWPGPLTLVLPRGPVVPDIVTASQPTVAVRMPDHPDFLRLLAAVPFPLAAPSANRSNRISPTTAAHVMDELSGRIPLVLDGGPCRVGLESTIVAVREDGGLLLLRPGGLPIESLQRVTGLETQSPSRVAAAPVAPGMRSVHYAPTRPLTLVPEGDGQVVAERLARLTNPRSVGILLLRGEPECPPAWQASLAGLSLVIRSLGDQGDGTLASERLFAALRALDGAGVDMIFVEDPSEISNGLWPAIKDRLNRAAAAHS